LYVPYVLPEKNRLEKPAISLVQRCDRGMLGRLDTNTSPVTHQNRGYREGLSHPQDHD